MATSYSTLITRAKKLAKTRDLTPDISVGKVGCALQTKNGNIFTGISISAAANLGHCAEVAAISQMLTAGESEVVAIASASDQGELITPCGRCRELLYQVNRQNVQTKIIMGTAKVFTLEELLPHRWQEYWSGRE